ncbi:MAG: hypothetical protein RLZZ405_531 [Verrucomicrobiota bacterium]|jgi:hypothetical protein
MKHITALTLTTLLAATGLAQTAAAPAASPVSYDLTAGYDSEYYYRGLWFSNQNAWYNIGASKKLSDKTTASALAYYTSSNDVRSQYQELDLGASVSYDAGFATVTAGYTYFFFFNGYLGNKNTGAPSQSFSHELYLSAAKTVGPVNVTATYAYDLYIDAGYAELAADKSFTLNDTTSLVLKAAAGYSVGGYYTLFNPANGQNVGTESTWTHVLLSASLPIALSKTATLTPYVSYNMSGAGREESNTGSISLGADNDQLFFGFSLKAVF